MSNDTSAAVEWLRDVATYHRKEWLRETARAILAHIAALEARAEKAEAEAGPYEARVCKGVPATCCDYAVVSLAAGREVCRVWEEDDARALAALLNGSAAPAPESRERELDKRRLDGLRELCGHVEDGSAISVSISQDDATRDWIIRAGKRWWHGGSLRAALDAALAEAEGRD